MNSRRCFGVACIIVAEGLLQHVPVPFRERESVNGVQELFNYHCGFTAAGGVYLFHNIIYLTSIIISEMDIVTQERSA